VLFSLFNDFPLHPNMLLGESDMSFSSRQDRFCCQRLFPVLVLTGLLQLLLLEHWLMSGINRTWQNRHLLLVCQSGPHPCHFYEGKSGFLGGSRLGQLQAFSR
jgi:hypothetical protein